MLYVCSENELHTLLSLYINKDDTRVKTMEIQRENIYIYYKIFI